MTTSEWWNHPARPCKNRPEFSDLSLLPALGRREEVNQLRIACRHCPVISECGTDMLTYRDEPRNQVRAGVVFK